MVSDDSQRLGCPATSMERQSKLSSGAITKPVLGGEVCRAAVMTSISVLGYRWRTGDSTRNTCRPPPFESTPSV
jgi:hypothetical protein